MCSTDILSIYRDRAIREITSDLERVGPHEFSSKLANSFFIYLIDLMSEEVDDPNELAMLVEDSLTTYDHDLSDFLLLTDYQISTQIVENLNDPIVKVDLTVQGANIFSFSGSFSDARLLKLKRLRREAYSARCDKRDVKV